MHSSQHNPPSREGETVEGSVDHYNPPPSREGDMAEGSSADAVIPTTPPSREGDTV